eukprot:8878713-Alexandrium_andersonii.AAC.1
MPSRPGLARNAHPRTAPVRANRAGRRAGPHATPRGHAPRTKPRQAGNHAHARHMEGVGCATSTPVGTNAQPA